MAAAFASSQFLTVGKSFSSSGSHSVQLLGFDLNNKKPLKFKPAMSFSVRASAGDSGISLFLIIKHLVMNTSFV